METFQLTRRFAGPASMGHGGYVSGLVAEHFLGAPASAPAGGAVQVTLRKPTPFDRDLALSRSSSGSVTLVCEGVPLVEAEPAELAVSLPVAPGLEEASAGEAASPSHYEGRGVHPSCFGCSSLREPGDALRIFAGPCHVAGQAIVAAPWVPGEGLADGSGVVPVRYVLAALDCPGAFAFMVDKKRPFLLGRIIFEQYRPVDARLAHVVVGWQIGEEGRKLFAGTALFDAAGVACAAAKATWFGPSPQ